MDEIEIAATLVIGGSDQELRLVVTGEYHGSQRLGYYGGEIGPTEPGESARFDYEKIEVFDMTQRKLVPFPFRLTEHMAEAVNEVALDRYEDQNG